MPIINDIKTSKAYDPNNIVCNVLDSGDVLIKNIPTAITTKIKDNELILDYQFIDLYLNKDFKTLTTEISKDIPDQNIHIEYESHVKDYPHNCEHCKFRLFTPDEYKDKCRLHMESERLLNERKNKQDNNFIKYHSILSDVEETIPDGCDSFQLKYLHFPISYESIDHDEFFKQFHPENHPNMQLVAIRPCDKECNNKTYIGILISEYFPIGMGVSFNNKNRLLDLSIFGNPGIYVPELNRIVFGSGSFWHRIGSKEDLKNISDDDIKLFTDILKIII